MWYKYNQTRSSNDPCGSTYHGSGPLSEPESSAIYKYIHHLFPKGTKRGSTLEAAQAKSTIACSETSRGILLDIHSAGNMVYFPWGHADILSPNHKSLLTMASKLAHAGNYSLWGPGQDGFLYFVGGDATDAAYGIDCVASFGFEIGSMWYAPCDEFQSSIVPIMTKNLIYAAKAAGAPYRIPLGPDVISMRLKKPNEEETTLTAKVSSRALVVNHAKFEPGQQAWQPIESVRLFVNSHPDDEGQESNGYFMVPTDGQFDQLHETVSFDLTTLSLVREKRHIIYVQATDIRGYSGPVSAIFYDA